MRLFVLAFTVLTALIHPTPAHDFSAEEPNEFIDMATPPSNSALPLEGMQLAVVQSVIDTYKLWDAGQTINVCFMGGKPDLRKFFVDVSAIWDDAGSFTFDFGAAPDFRTCEVSDTSHIRVRFGDGGNWSYVGTDALSISTDQPTLSIAPLANWRGATRRIGGTILHELGHALALKHEHQSPDSNCEAQLNWEVIYEELAQPPNGWDEAKVDHNLREYMKSDRLRVSEYDRKSIMHYALPANWFLDGQGSSCFVNRNDTPSPSDLVAVSESYPNTPNEQDLYFGTLDAANSKALSQFDFSEETLAIIDSLVQKSIGAVEGREVESNLSTMTVVNQIGDCPINVNGGTSTVTCTFN